MKARLTVVAVIVASVAMALVAGAGVIIERGSPAASGVIIERGSHPLASGIIIDRK